MERDHQEKENLQAKEEKKRERNYEPVKIIVISRNKEMA